MDNFKKHLQIAEQHSANMGRPQVIVVAGLMGSGKSTLASKLSHELNSQLIQTDMVRGELFSPGASVPHYGAGKYSESNKNQVYQRIFELMKKQLTSGRSVVIDGTFGKNMYRKALADTCQNEGVEIKWILCQCDDETAKERISKRSNDPFKSEARVDFYDAQKISSDYFLGENKWLKIDSSLPTTRQLAQALKGLSKHSKNHFGSAPNRFHLKTKASHRLPVYRR